MLGALAGLGVVLGVLGALAGLGMALGVGFGRAGRAGLGVGFGRAGRAGWIGCGKYKSSLLKYKSILSKCTNVLLNTKVYS